ncbi:MAG TPA: hypothetical protein VMV16_03815 [Solirubrobacteraceae bacterium]|nr:hypothetical protein [Solirubrobacteraceae bacterium]
MIETARDAVPKVAIALPDGLEHVPGRIRGDARLRRAACDRQERARATNGFDRPSMTGNGVTECRIAGCGYGDARTLGRASDTGQPGCADPLRNETPVALRIESDLAAKPIDCTALPCGGAGDRCQRSGLVDLPLCDQRPRLRYERDLDSALADGCALFR